MCWVWIFLFISFVFFQVRFEILIVINSSLRFQILMYILQKYQYLVDKLFIFCNSYSRFPLASNWVDFPFAFSHYDTWKSGRHQIWINLVHLLIPLCISRYWCTCYGSIDIWLDELFIFCNLYPRFPLVSKRVDLPFSFSDYVPFKSGRYQIWVKLITAPMSTG